MTHPKNQLGAANQPADYLARQQALSATESFAVSAPAGSGKTELLAQRVLTLLAHSDAPENILCITFTRKAASEMLARIVHALESACNPEPTEPHKKHTWQLAKAALEQDKKQNWQLLENPNRLNIQTIDGLCRALAKQLPLESGLGAVPDAMQSPGIAYLEAARKTVQLLEHEVHGPHLKNLLLHVDNNIETLEKLLITLLSNRDIWLGDVLATRQTPKAYFEYALKTLNVETLKKVHKELQPHSSSLALLADYAGSNLVTDAPGKDSPLKQCAGITDLPECTPESHSKWLGICDLLLTQKNEWRKTVNKSSGFPTEHNGDKAAAKTRKEDLANLIATLKTQPALLGLLEDVRALPPVEIPEQQWQILAALTHLLPVAVAQLQLVFQAQGECDYTEITLAALQALGDEDAPTDLSLLLDHSLHHILVDEFQDTSSSQLTLLNRLTAGWERGDGKTLFVVGDGMQSIYGFRNANVGIFLDIRERGLKNIAVTPLDLTVNFRSDQGVVDWVNHTFKQAFPPQNDIARGAVSYTPAIAHRPLKNSPAVQTHLFGDNKVEAQEIATLVATTLEEYPENSIAILVKARSHLVDIVSALREKNISWQATDIDPLATRQSILDLLSLSKALLNPGDRISWLSLLRSPWIGLPLSDLHFIANSNRSHNQTDWPVIWSQLNDQQLITQLSPDSQKILARALPVLQAAWNQRRRKPLREWIEGTWEALGGLAGLLTPSDAVDIPSFFDLLEAHSEAALIKDWPVFLKAVNELYAAPLPNADARVQVMTIHKSKGLEFDTVIIPGLARGSRPSDSPLLLSQERLTENGDPHLIIAPLAATGEDTDPCYAYLRGEEKRKGTLESARLLYVGVTRAVSRLYLTGVLNENTKAKSETAEPNPPATNSLLARIWPVLNNPAGAETKEYTYTPALTTQTEVKEESSLTEPGPEHQHLARLPASWQVPECPENDLLSSFRGATEGFDSESNAPEYSREHRITGTLLHRTLQQITEDGTDSWTPERIQQQLPVWQAQFRQQGLIAYMASGIEKLQQAVNTILASNVGQWLMDNNHTESACELAISYRRGGRVRRAVVDRTFVDQGTRWIIDYKSAAPGPQQPLNDFLAQQQQLYHKQLSHYEKLFLNMESLPIKKALFFPLIGHLLTVDA